MANCPRQRCTLGATRRGRIVWMARCGAVAPSAGRGSSYSPRQANCLRLAPSPEWLQSGLPPSFPSSCPSFFVSFSVSCFIRKSTVSLSVASLSSDICFRARQTSSSSPTVFVFFSDTSFFFLWVNFSDFVLLCFCVFVLILPLLTQKPTAHRIYHPCLSPSPYSLRLSAPRKKPPTKTPRPRKVSGSQAPT